MNNIGPAIFEATCTDAYRVIEDAFGEGEICGSISVQLIDGFAEDDYREGREEWGFYATRIDNITDERIQLVGGLCYRVQFGTRHLYRYQLFDNEEQANEFHREFFSEKQVPMWSDVRSAIGRSIGLLWFASRAMLALAIRRIRLTFQRRKTKSRNKGS